MRYLRIHHQCLLLLLLLLHYYVVLWMIESSWTRCLPIVEAIVLHVDLNFLGFPTAANYTREDYQYDALIIMTLEKVLKMVLTLSLRLIEILDSESLLVLHGDHLIDALIVQFLPSR